MHNNSNGKSRLKDASSHFSRQIVTKEQMNITIYRNGENYGPYTLGQIKEHLDTGALIESDLAWHEGCSDWLPLKTIISKATVPPPPPSFTIPLMTHEEANLTSRKRFLSAGKVFGLFICLMVVLTLFMFAGGFRVHLSNPSHLATNSPEIDKSRTVISATIVNISPDVTDWKVGDIQVTFADGRTKVITNGEKCAHPLVSGTGDVGWSIWNDLTNDRYQHTSETLRIQLHDGTIKNFKPNSLYIMEWWFADNNSAAVIQSMEHHGPASFVKYDISSGNELGRQDGYLPYDKMAKWVQPYSDEKPNIPDIGHTQLAEQQQKSEGRIHLNDSSLIGTYYGTNKSGDQMALKLGADHLFGIMNITRTDTAPVIGSWKIDTSSNNEFVSLLTPDGTTVIMDEYPDAYHPGTFIDSLNNIFTRTNSTTAETPTQSDYSASSSDTSTKMVLSANGERLVPQNDPDAYVQASAPTPTMKSVSGYYVNNGNRMGNGTLMLLPRGIFEIKGTLLQDGGSVGRWDLNDSMIIFYVDGQPWAKGRVEDNIIISDELGAKFEKQ